MSGRDMDYESGSRAEFDDRDYRRDERSASPRGARRGDSPPRGGRPRSMSPGARRSDERFVDEGYRRDDAYADKDNSSAPPEGQDESRGGSAKPANENPGTNLFVMGIHPKLTEEDITRLFSKYGDVVKCQIMVDPHTRESRSFGFVEMATIEQADSAREGLQGEFFEGRTLSIQKAKRGRPRTPTPGKYFGPPKRNDFRRGPPPRGYSSYDDRRGGGRSYGSRYDDDRYSSRYDDRGYSNGRDHYRRDRDDYGSRGGDRYDDRYRRDDRGGRGYYDRDSRSDREGGYSRGDDRGPVPAGGAGAPPEPPRSYYRDEADRPPYRR